MEVDNMVSIHTPQVASCNLQGLPVELLLQIMKSMNFPALGALTIAWPASAGVVRNFEDEILQGILDSSDSPEITRLMAAVMIVRSHRPNLLLFPVRKTLL